MTALPDANTNMVISPNISTLSILLHYDCNKLSIIRKALPHHAKEMQADIRSQSALERNQWIMVRVRPEDMGAYNQALSYQGKGRPPTTKVIWTTMMRQTLLVASTDKVKLPMAGLLTGPSKFGIYMSLDYARHFRRLLERETGGRDAIKGSTSLSATDEVEENKWRDEEGGRRHGGG